METVTEDYEIVISEKVKNTFDRYMGEYHYKVESGGILVGRIIDRRIIIEDLTEPFASDKRGRYSFFRSSKGHQEFMDEVWTTSRESCAYLGEWHTHDQVIISPSEIDYNNWKSIMSRSNNTDALVFIILGRTNFAMWVGVGDQLISTEKYNYIDHNKENY